MLVVNTNTYEVFDTDFLKVGKNEPIEELINVKVRKTDTSALLIAYDQQGNKYTASQSLERYNMYVPFFATKTSVQALQMKNNKVVQLGDYKRAKEERTATKKEKWFESFTNFKHATAQKIEEFFELDEE